MFNWRFYWTNGAVLTLSEVTLPVTNTLVGSPEHATHWHAAPVRDGRAIHHARISIRMADVTGHIFMSATVFYLFAVLAFRQRNCSKPCRFSKLSLDLQQTSVGLATVYKWFNEFKCGRINLTDDLRDGDPSKEMAEDNMSVVRLMIETDKRIFLTSERTWINLRRKRIKSKRSVELQFAASSLARAQVGELVHALSRSVCHGTDMGWQHAKRARPTVCGRAVRGEARGAGAAGGATRRRASRVPSPSKQV
ncbi:hypothetical protein EVAR_69791_1 [Eumeta japonica]|uniref:Histone-lysine N-methyltransferase SETMAR n=1 Tax=Eumeta variegata TaxID=151549 RepID=A0A4C2A714_EUMVA|nr:hypothetical protein EVAR_69791_1 [Eumeta japonica]